jgi:hypothetical protein
VSRGDPTGLNTVEIRADAAALYLMGAADSAGPPSLDGSEPLGGRPEVGVPGAPGPGLGPSPIPDARSDAIIPATGPVESAYLEGDVILSYGDRTIRASRLYFDFQNDRALILDAVAFMPSPTREVPIYVRSERVRQLSATEWTAYDAKLTTDDFYTPHYHVGASKIEFEDRTPRSLAGDVTGARAGRFKMTHSTFNILDVPFLYWPYVQGDLDEDVTPLRRVRSGYSETFGVELESDWELFSLLGLQRPRGMSAELSMDVYTERGPGIGINSDYEFDNSFGLFRGYYINDGGTDRLGPIEDETPPNANRGRATWRHRQYLPDDWQLTLEASYVSDLGFLEQYFEREFDVGKEQETLVFLKKQRDNWAFTALANFHILDFFTETEHLPDVTFRLTGQPLGGLGTLYSENRAGVVRYRYFDRWLWENLYYGKEPSSGSTLRADSRQEVGFPLDLGPLRVVPFGSIRGTTWDDSVASGNLSRVFGTYGLRSSMYFWRVFEEVRSKLLDITGIRHVIKPDITAWGAHTNVDSQEQFLFDETVEDIDEIDGVTVGVRQRWQTKRGEPGRQRVVDWVILDLELGVFNDAPGTYTTDGYASYTRPESSFSRNYVYGQLLWRVTDSTVLATEGNYDMDDGEMDVFSVSLAVERRPRLGYVIGYRFIDETESNLLGAGINYQLSEKYTIAVREAFDLERGETEEFTVALIRKLPRWYVGLTFELDEINDDFGISLSAWPEGFPQAALGTRRFTGLATSTGIRP